MILESTFDPLAPAAAASSRALCEAAGRRLAESTRRHAAPREPQASAAT